MNKYFSSIGTIIIIGLGAVMLYRMAINDEKKYIITRLLREQGLADTEANRDKFSDKTVDELRLMIKR